MSRGLLLGLGHVNLTFSQFAAVASSSKAVGIDILVLCRSGT